MSDRLEQEKMPSRGLALWRTRWPMAGVASLAALAIVAGAVRAAEHDGVARLVASQSAVSGPISAPAQARQLPSFADLAQRVTPAVVSVYVSAEETGGITTFGEQSPGQNGSPGSPFEFFFRRFGQPGFETRPHLVQAQGSGFFISPDGYILTNNHVVDHAKSVKVRTVDGKTYPAKVVGTDAKTDLAVIKVTGKGSFPFVAFADAAPRIGDWVLAVGNPFGLGGTVTAGIVSAQGRDIGSGSYNDFLQIDAPVNKGNSGGPTFNLQGQVVGVNTAIYSPSGGSIGIAFDIPAETAKTVAAQLESKGAVTRGWIGVSVQPVTQEIADSLNLKQPKGALVDEVQGSGPAAKAGLKTGDVIMSLDGAAITDARDLARKVAAESPGKAISMGVWRDDQEQTLGLTIATLPTETAATPAAEAERGQPRLGLALAPAARVTGAGSQGVVVVSVDPEGAAAEKGIQPGDVILGVGGKRVSTPRDVSSDVEAVAKAGRHAVLLRVKSAVGTHFVAVPIRRG